MEAAIRFSQNSLPGQDNQHFLKIDIAGRSLQLYNIRRFSRRSLKYDLTHSSKKLAPFRAFDWHPTAETLVAVGQTGGEAGLVNLAYPDQKPLSFIARNPRSCNAVALNITDWIAVGLDKARSDNGLYVWDVDHHVSQSSSKTSRKPLHQVASGESVTSLRFFQDQPKLLAAGLTGYVRLYDLRDSSPSCALQFSTRCINNIAIDNKDENYFASCLQSNTPTVAVWDRRMISRTEAPSHFGFATPVSQSEQQPEISAELGNVAESDSHIFGLRFSKSHRGHLGVLSSSGQLKIITFLKNDVSIGQQLDQKARSPSQPIKQEPQNIYVDNVQNVLDQDQSSKLDADGHKFHSFDFTTATSRNGQPTIITLGRNGEIGIRPAIASKNHAPISSALILDDVTSQNGLTQLNRTLSTAQSDIANTPSAMSSSKDELSAVIHSLALPRQRCLDGYLLDATKNCSIVAADDKVSSLWKWLDHSKTISANGVLIEDNINLSYIGICDLWTDEIDVQARSLRGSFILEQPHISALIRDTARRLHLMRGKGCSTDYLQHRALCLHLLGLPWLRTDVQKECDRLVAKKELTKAAAIALFAGEEKIAQKALRAAGSANGHKMLAMALVSSRSRVQKSRRGSQTSGKSDEQKADSSDDSQDEEWQDIISAISADLTDCYAKSILALVKTNKWEDVISQTCLPLLYRVMVALRHANDTNLSGLLLMLKRQAISSGDLEGIFLTGLGSPSSIDLLTRYTEITGDIQTSALAMSFEAVSDRFLPSDSPSMRIVHCYRETYKSLLMAQSLKFDKVRFTIALSRALRSHDLPLQPRRKEQIRLICSYCSQSLSTFGHEQQTQSDESRLSIATATSASFTETVKQPLTPQKAATIGTACPKCGRHLPRCGVCDMWLGTPDETFSKWYSKSVPTQGATSTSSHRNSNDHHTNNSMANSTLTAIGPGTGTPTLPAVVVSNKATNKKLTAADLPLNVVEVVDANSELAKQKKEQEKERKWYEDMHRFTVFCTRCSHGFHAEHARMWFEGKGTGQEGMEGHKECPVPGCTCSCAV